MSAVVAPCCICQGPQPTWRSGLPTFNAVCAVAGALVYIASEDRARNRNYLGPATVQELAVQIASAHGPSGPNAEYLYRLADAMVQVSRVYPAPLLDGAACTTISSCNICLPTAHSA